MQLRDYQQDTITLLYEWFGRNSKGNPCVVLPTGAGKSVVIASLCKDALTNWPDTKILMLSRQKEIIEQNAEKMIALWPNAPLGVYSASIGRRDLSQPITFASIGSVLRRAEEIGHVDLVLVDEAHHISGRREGGYRSLIDALKEINPALRVVGFTATPYRLGQGLVVDGKEALFSSMIEPTTVRQLIEQGYLCRLTSKVTTTHYDVSGVRKRGGEFIERELQQAVSDELTNREAVQEIIRRAENRRSWIIFCTGVDHARQVAQMLNDAGITATCVDGQMGKAERESVLERFKAGEFRAITNCNILTTGFDSPDIDLVALMRPTLSPGLYAQMVGRGLRIADGKKDCLVLDFAENINRHGPITDINPPAKPGERGGGEAPVKECPECAELVHTSIMICPDCGYQWPEPERKYTLSDRDIMGEDNVTTMAVSDWLWRTTKSRRTGIEMLIVDYYGENLSDEAVREYITLKHDGYAGRKAARTLADIVHGSMDGQPPQPMPSLEDIAKYMNENARPPVEIRYEIQGRFKQVIGRHWTTEVMHD